MILAFVALGAVVRMKRGYYLIANKQAKELREKSKKKSSKKKSTKKKKSSKKK
jgi:ribosomal protein L9